MRESNIADMKDNGNEEELAFAVKIPPVLWNQVTHRLVDQRLTKKVLVIQLLEKWLEESSR